MSSLLTMNDSSFTGIPAMSDPDRWPHLIAFLDHSWDCYKLGFPEAVTEMELLVQGTYQVSALMLLRRERKQDWAGGKIEILSRTIKVSAKSRGSSGMNMAWGNVYRELWNVCGLVPHWAKIAGSFYPHLSQSLDVVLPANAVPMGEAAVCSRGQIWRSWRLLTDS